MTKRQYRSDRVPVDPDNWSEDSKRSYIFESPPAEYKDSYYLCRRCKRPSVFTAEEQRQTYEVRKAYIWQRRHLCEECFRVRVRIETELKACIRQWQQESPTPKNNTDFLRRWLSLIEEHAAYGARLDYGNSKMLRRLLAGQTPKTPR